MNDEEKGAIQVNNYLTSLFGHRFLSLQAIKDSEGEAQMHFEIIRNGERAYHLSEGECSLISFCYFMAKLGDVDTKDTKPIIWIDDPVSSLDGNHIFFIYSLIAAEIAEKGAFEQLFVSTHNLEFLKYLRGLKSQGCKKQYFLVERMGSYSEIKKLPNYLKEYATEFNYLFSCIYSCANSEINDSNFEKFYCFGNNARKFLEMYLYFKYPDDSSNKLERFFGKGKVPVILTERVDNEYSHLKGSFERALKPIEAPEMKSVAKLIIEKLKEDEEQYRALLSSVNIKE